jgi:hypothetical protein
MGRQARSQARSCSNTAAASGEPPSAAAGAPADRPRVRFARSGFRHSRSCTGVSPFSTARLAGASLSAPNAPWSTAM